MRLDGTVLRAAAVLTISACAGRGEPVGAIETRPVRHIETGFPPAGEDLGPSAVGYVLAADAAGLSSEDDYQVIAVTSQGGIRHARLQQTRGGLPVVGSEIVAHADDTTF